MCHDAAHLEPALAPVNASTPNAAKNPAQGWVSVRHVQHMIARGEAAGLRVDELLGAVGLARDRLADAEGVVPLSAIETLLATLSSRYGDPLMGLHLAEAIQPATFGVMGYILQACPTFADVLDVASRYNGLLSNIGHTSIVREPGIVRLRWDCLTGSPLFRRHATEYVLGAVTVLYRLLLPEQRHLPAAVHFAHAAPADAERVREYFDFFKCPVFFDKPASCIVIPSSTLSTRMHHGDAFVREMMERHARQILEQRGQQTSLTDQVRQLLRAMILDGTPTQEAVARQLGTSSRSLHRRLQASGTGYRELLDSVRLEQAQARLTGSDDALQRIAQELGFQSHQAFLRWFKQRAGITPGEYRIRQREHRHEGP